MKYHLRIVALSHQQVTIGKHGSLLYFILYLLIIIAWLYYMIIIMLSIKKKKYFLMKSQQKNTVSIAIQLYNYYKFSLDVLQM